MDDLFIHLSVRFWSLHCAWRGAQGSNKHCLFLFPAGVVVFMEQDSSVHFRVSAISFFEMYLFTVDELKKKNKCEWA